MNTKNPLAPPIVYAASGLPVGTVGSRGHGPGETTIPDWLDASLDDSIRVFEPGRVLIFSKELKYARTVMDASPQMHRFVAVLRPGTYVMMSREVSAPNVKPEPNPLLVRTEAGRLLHRIDIPLLNGGIPKVVFARDLNDPHRIWLAESQERLFDGYRIVHLDETGERRVSFDRRPGWWQITDRRLHAALPVSFVIDIRQIGTDLLLVLMATPRADWRSIPADDKTMVGYWERLETAVEVVDFRRHKLVGFARTPGYPVSITGKDEIATYAEDDDGFPVVVLWRFALRQS